MMELLQLMQLSDSAVPIGAAAHSFGLEGMAELGAVDATSLESFLDTYLWEQGAMEAWFCRAAYKLGTDGAEVSELCTLMSAWKPARESREGSAVLGRRLLTLCSTLLPAEQSSRLSNVFNKVPQQHHSIVFGYVAAQLHINEEAAVAAFVHQAVTAMISAAQRLMPVGQRQAAASLWSAKRAIAAVAANTRTMDLSSLNSFMPLLEVASMRHPNLETRLFLS